MYRQPDVLNRSRSGNVGKRYCMVPGHGDTRGNLPTLSEFTGSYGASAFGSHATLAFGAGGIFGTERACAGGRQPPQIAEVYT
jgi:hypothetical protein